jgi:hypothetical protein
MNTRYNLKSTNERSKEQEKINTSNSEKKEKREKRRMSKGEKEKRKETILRVRESR